LSLPPQYLGLRARPIRLRDINLAVYTGFTASFFDLDRRMGFDVFETKLERMCNVYSKKFLPAVACALALSFFAAMTAEAETIDVTYALSGSGGGDPLNPPLLGNATGSLSPLGNIVWSDMIFPDFSTGSGDGTFKMTFTDGDTLFGTLHVQGDFSSFPIVPFTQLLTVTGGTGALLLYHGTLNGIELSNQLDGSFTSSGGGMLETAPEPESLVLFGTGLASLLAYRKRALLFKQDCRQSES
jgi:PEP-CTERM motif